MAKLNEPIDKIYRSALTEGGAVILRIHAIIAGTLPPNAVLVSRRDGHLADSGDELQIRNAGFQRIGIRRNSVVAWDACRELSIAHIGARHPGAKQALDAFQGRGNVWEKPGTKPIAH